MISRVSATCLIFGAILGWLTPINAATVDCSLPIAQLTAAQFADCLHLASDHARVVPLRKDEIEDAAPKPTTQRAADDLLHGGGD
jgi:hypothetical protein